MPRLSFAEYQIIDENIVLFSADKGVALDIPQAKECLALYQELNRPLGILVDRSTPYTSSLEFIMTIAEFSLVKALAVWVPNERSAVVADSQKMFFPVPFQRFYRKDEALTWIKQHLS
ncbi:hypothetical protein ACU6U9_10765 [Pseudomonas sp. HK3]|jgi:hypothetical protein